MEYVTTRPGVNDTMQKTRLCMREEGKRMPRSYLSITETNTGWDGSHTVPVPVRHLRYDIRSKGAYFGDLGRGKGKKEEKANREREG